MPRVPPTFAARHCLQGCGDVPRVLPVDCTAPLRRLAQAQAQWLPMQLMKVRTPCTRAPYAMRVSHMHLRTRAHRPAQMCVCCTQRGSVGLWGSRRDSPRGSRSPPPSMRPDTCARRQPARRRLRRPVHLRRHFVRRRFARRRLRRPARRRRHCSRRVLPAPIRDCSIAAPPKHTKSLKCARSARKGATSPCPTCTCTPPREYPAPLQYLKKGKP